MAAIYRREGSLCKSSKSRGEKGEIVGSSSRLPVVSDYELWNTIEAAASTAASGLQAWMPQILEQFANTPMSFGNTDMRDRILVQIACSNE